jgi:hypothetical protein
MHTEILMSASESSRFPVARLQALANARHEWVALLRRLHVGDAAQADSAATTASLSALFASAVKQDPALHSLLQMPMQDILGVLSLRIDVAMALQQRSGALGQMLALVASFDVAAEALMRAAVGAESGWRSLLQSCQCAIVLYRN